VRLRFLRILVGQPFHAMEDRGSGLQTVRMDAQPIFSGLQVRVYCPLGQGRFTRSMHSNTCCVRGRAGMHHVQVPGYRRGGAY
jgi:hypothetical protein